MLNLIYLNFIFNLRSWSITFFDRKIFDQRNILKFILLTHYRAIRIKINLLNFFKKKDKF